MILFAAATGLRPSEWVALERRDLDLDASVVYVRRAFTDGQLRAPKTRHSLRAVPLQDVALAALKRCRADSRRSCSRRRGAATSTSTTGAPAPGGQRSSKPGVELRRRVYDLRHTFATFALRAGVPTFDLCRDMGTSLAMIERHYGHLARDAHQHAGGLRDEPAAAEAVDVAWTPSGRRPPRRARRRGPTRRGAADREKPSNGLEPLTPSLPWRCSTN